MRNAIADIRRVGWTDLPALQRLIAAFASYAGGVASIGTTQLVRDLFGAQPWATALVAESSGRLVGYAILVPTYRAHLGARGADLHQLFVDDGHRGQGIGRLLVDAAMAHARGLECDYLTVGSRSMCVVRDAA